MTTDIQFDLDWLLQGMDEKLFFGDYWEKRPLHIPSMLANKFESFFSLKDFEQAIFRERIEKRDLSILQYQRLQKNTCDYFDAKNRLIPSKIFEAYKDNSATVCLEYPEKNCINIGSLCKSLSKIFYTEAITSLFLGPPNSTGLNVHFDYYNAFILQISGRKRWRLYDFAMSNPSCEKDRFKLNQVDLGSPILDVILEEGDVLYLPRGTPHQPSCLDSHSLHLTLGLKTHTWADILHQSIDNLRDCYPIMRESLPSIKILKRNQSVPTETLTKVLELITNQTSLPTIVNAIEEEYSLSEISEIDGEFVNLIRSSGLALDTKLMHSEKSLPIVNETEDNIEILFCGSRLKWPLVTKEAVLFIVSNTNFTTQEICKNLTDSTKICLIEKFISVGFLNTVKNHENQAT